MRFFSLYQYIAPAIAVPLAYWLFLQRYAGNHALVAFFLAVPITFSYVVPAIGMNVLHLWRMNTRVRIGRIRPHHGLVFGSASSLFALLSLDPLQGPLTLGEPFRAGLTLGAVIGFWNWLYDLIAIRAGFIEVYNRQYANGEGPEAIATDYSPPVFGGFGFVYGFSMRIAEGYLPAHPGLYWPLLIGTMFTSVALPVAVYVGQSYWLYGDAGLRSYENQPPS